MYKSLCHHAGHPSLSSCTKKSILACRQEWNSISITSPEALPIPSMGGKIGFISISKDSSAPYKESFLRRKIGRFRFSLIDNLNLSWSTIEDFNIKVAKILKSKAPKSKTLKSETPKFKTPKIEHSEIQELNLNRT